MLPINFHKTFIPERRYLTALLQYAASGKEGTFQEIGQDTGIPMGASTGKVPAILDYGRGMGLIEVTNCAGGRKKMELTAFGRTVYLEDKGLSEPMVQWLLHIHLCRPDNGAAAWHEVFAKGRMLLGQSFTEEQLEEYLVGLFGPGRNRTGPLVSTYTEDAAFARANILKVDKQGIVRLKAPLLPSYAYAYAALILDAMERYFAGQDQVPITDLSRETSLFDICYWNQADMERLCTLIERCGHMTVDRQRQPWILEKRINSVDVWQLLFRDV